MATQEEWEIDAAMAERAAKDAVHENTRCKHCGHAAYAHCKDGLTPNVWEKGECIVCGCIKFEARPPRDEATLREWIVKAEFFCKNRWLSAEVRVKAAGPAGAIIKGYRLAKKEAVKPRARVAQHRVTLIPISKGKGR